VYDQDTTLCIQVVNYGSEAMKVDPADLLNSRDVARVLGLSHREAVATYRGRYVDFPEPVVSKGTCVLWRRSDIQKWQGERRQPAPDETTRALLSGHVTRLLLVVRLQAGRVLDGSDFATAEYDAYLFVYALRDLRLASIAARPWSPAAVDTAVISFDEAMPGVKDVRDIYAHIDEYEKGSGRLQKQGRVEQPIRWLERGHRTAVLTVLPFRVEIHTGLASAETLAGDVLEVLVP
jgi:predicted DNA-binding transcriptional regulator AlpA